MPACNQVIPFYDCSRHISMLNLMLPTTLIIILQTVRIEQYCSHSALHANSSFST